MTLGRSQMGASSLLVRIYQRPRPKARNLKTPTIGTRNQTSEIYLAEIVHKVVLQKSILVQIRQLILYMSDNKGKVDEFVRELTGAKRLYKHFL